METSLLQAAVDLVKAQASVNRMSGEELEAALIRVYNALHRLRRAEEDDKPIPLTGETSEGSAGHSDGPGSADPHGSIQEERIKCLECGAEFRQITANHLRTHELTPREYKRKWGFPLKQALAAKMLTKLRSRSAKKRGLPVKLQQYLQDQREKKSAAGSEAPATKKGAGRRTNRPAGPVQEGRSNP